MQSKELETARGQLLKYQDIHKGAEPMESFEPKKSGADTNLARY